MIWCVSVWLFNPHSLNAAHNWVVPAHTQIVNIYRCSHWKLSICRSCFWFAYQWIDWKTEWLAFLSLLAHTSLLCNVNHHFVPFELGIRRLVTCVLNRINTSICVCVYIFKLYCHFDGYYNWLSDCQVNHNHRMFCWNEPIHCVSVCGDIMRTMDIELYWMKLFSWWFRRHRLIYRVFTLVYLNIVCVFKSKSRGSTKHQFITIYSRMNMCGFW